MTTNATSSAGPAPPLLVQTLGELLAAPPEPREFLLEPWMLEGDSSLIYAPTGAGKSIFTLALALAIAGGGSLLGWTAKRPRRVLLIDGEMPRADIHDRASMLLPSIRGCDSEAVRENLRFLVQQAQHADTAFPDMDKPAGQSAVLDMVRGGGVDVLILDNFSTLFECPDENSASAFNGVAKFLKRIKQAGIACILVHHTGKNATTYRGSSKLAMTFETLIHLQPTTRAIPPGALGMDMSWHKFRRKRGANAQDRTVWLTDSDSEGGARWGHDAPESEALASLVEEAKTGAYRTQGDLAKKLGKSPGELSKMKTRAIRLGLTNSEEWGACFGNGAAAVSSPVPSASAGTP